jgi:DNA-binding CsgD family transcriptional regulator
MVHEELLDKIYNAPIDPDLWTSILDDVTAMLDARGSVLLVERNDGWVGWRSTESLKPQINHQIENHLDTRFAVINNRLKSRNSQDFIAEHYLFDEQEWLETPFMKEYGIPNGLKHTVGAYIELPQGDKILIFSVRDKNKPKFEDHEIEQLNQLRPHLARAAMLTTNIGLKRISSFIDAMNNISLKALVVDKAGIIIFDNNSLEFFKEYLIILKSNKIEFTNKNNSAQFSDLITDTINTNKPKSIPIRSSDDRAAILHFMPIASFYKDFFDTSNIANNIFDTTNVVVILTPVARNTETSSTIIRGLFDLTATEAKITSKISDGTTIDQIAETMKVSKETIRTHLKNIFSKTGVNRQSQLVALIAGIGSIGSIKDDFIS